MSLVVRDRAKWALPSLLRDRAEQLGDRPFVSCGLDESSLTYRQADVDSDRLASGLTSLGVRAGDRVLVMMRNRIEFVLSWFAIAKLGAVLVAVNVDYRAEFLEHLANTSQAPVLLTEDRLLDAVAASSGRLTHLRTLVVANCARRPSLPGMSCHRFQDVLLSDPAPRLPVRPEDDCAIQFTSGTTGRSKGAFIPHAALHLLCERNRELLALDEGSVYLTQLPLFHVNAQMTVYCCLLVGARARVEERFSASGWLAQVRASGATHTSMLGVMVEFVLRQPCSEHDRRHLLRSVWSVPCLPEPGSMFRRRFGIDRLVTSYGTTEIGMVARRVVEQPEDATRLEIGTEYYDVRIVDPDTRAVLDTETVGEIEVRQKVPSITMRGYVGGAEEAGTGWVPTGDAGVLDGHGRLRFIDRLHDRIRRRGENVASADLEYVLAQHQDVAEVAVVGVPAPQGGEDEIKACIVPAVAAPRFDVAALWAWCAQRLPYFAVPRYVDVLPELPKTATAKVRKQELRARGVSANTADRGPTGRVGSR